MTLHIYYPTTVYIALFIVTLYIIMIQHCTVVEPVVLVQCLLFYSDSETGGTPAEFEVKQRVYLTTLSAVIKHIQAGETD